MNEQNKKDGDKAFLNKLSIFFDLSDDSNSIKNSFLICQPYFAARIFLTSFANLSGCLFSQVR